MDHSESLDSEEFSAREMAGKISGGKK